MNGSGIFEVQFCYSEIRFPVAAEKTCLVPIKNCHQMQQK